MELDQLKENLVKIEQAGNNIVSLTDLAFIEKERVMYLVKQGDCHGVGVWNDMRSAIQYAILGAKTEMQKHIHGETEILILVSGDFRLRFETYNLHAITGVPIVVPPSTPHTAISDNGCELIAITIPASPAYPTPKIV